MAISQSLYTGVTGLSAMADNMSIIANNISNASTKGFKYDRGEFEDMLSLDLGGSASFSQIGRGARLRATSSIFSQGGLTGTDGLTDLAVQGDGFFVVKNQKAIASDSGGMFYTRNGAFQFDKNGYLVDMNYGRVQGYTADAQGRLQPRLDDIRIIKTNLPPSPTKKAEMILNLDQRSESVPEFNYADPKSTANFSSSMTIYDSAGNSHEATIYFRREPGEENVWSWHAGVDGKEVIDGKQGEFSEIATGKLIFNEHGNLQREEYDKNEANFIGGVKPDQKILFDFGLSVEEGGDGVGQTTSNATDSTIITHSQDGYETGNLKTLKIDLDGAIRGVFSNGVERQLGSVGLATFNNIRGLKKAGMASFYATNNSGPPSIGIPQSGNRGSIYSSSLEESNVDLATQFVQMIMTQRNFQANSRAITTTDSMVEEVVNLKR